MVIIETMFCGVFDKDALMKIADSESQMKFGVTRVTERVLNVSIIDRLDVDARR